MTGKEAAEFIEKMTNKEAAEVLKNVKFWMNGGRRNGKIYLSLAYDKALDLAIKALEERPQGEWIRITNESANIQMFLCSECGRKVEVGYSHISPNVYYPFCHCGADMRGGEG